MSGALRTFSVLNLLPSKFVCHQSQPLQIDLLHAIEDMAINNFELDILRLQAHQENTPFSHFGMKIHREDNLALLQLYLWVLVTGAFCPCWCFILYAVAVAHVSCFVFS